MTRDAVTTKEIFPPIGPFSPAVRAGEFIFLSGQVAQDPKSGLLIDGDAAEQSTQIFANISAVLRACGKTLADVVRVGVFLTNMSDYAAMNAVYERQFTPPYPARTAVAVAALPLGAKVEIEVVAR